MREYNITDLVLDYLIKEAMICMKGFFAVGLKINLKILWRQTASSLLAVIDNKKRWFRNTIQCGYLKDDYKNTVDLLYALAIFNSKYIDYVYRKMVLETGRVFPRVKIKYLKQLPFILPQKDKQQFLAGLAKRITDLNKKLVAA